MTCLSGPRGSQDEAPAPPTTLRTVDTMAPARRPTAADRADAIQIALGGIAAGADLDDVAQQLAPLHPKHNTFPGEVLLDLAADALELSGASRAAPIHYEGIRERYLPEIELRGKTQHHKSHYALRAVAMIRAGMTPDLLDEVSWWNANDLWVWSLYALVVYVRVAAEKTHQPPRVICEQIAQRHGVELSIVR